MPRQIVFTSKAAKPPPTYSQAVKAAGLVFVSGTAPTDPATGAIIKWFPANPPARQGAKLPARIPGLKVSIAAIAEA